MIKRIPEVREANDAVRALASKISASAAMDVRLKVEAAFMALAAAREERTAARGVTGLPTWEELERQLGAMLDADWASGIAHRDESTLARGETLASVREQMDRTKREFKATLRTLLSAAEQAETAGRGEVMCAACLHPVRWADIGAANAEIAKLRSAAEQGGKAPEGKRGELFRAIASELDHAYAKHGREPWGRHEFYAILLEEVEELKEAIFRDQPIADVLAELRQVAAMCFRYAETGDRYWGEHPAIPARQPKQPTPGQVARAEQYNDIASGHSEVL